MNYADHIYRSENKYFKFLWVKKNLISFFSRKNSVCFQKFLTLVAVAMHSITSVPFTKPDASRAAAPPAKITKTAYEMADIKRARSVPFGIELAGSFKSPEMFAPACSPVTKSKQNIKVTKRFWAFNAA